MSLVGKIARRIGGTEPFLRLMPYTVVPFDRLLGRLTRGRVVSMNLDDLPTLLITTTGRKSGLPRTQPLLYGPDGDGFVVAGSNFGKPDHPDWSYNLIATPEAEVRLRGEVIPVRATLAEGAERERLVTLLLSIWPHYATYSRRSGRHLRVFRLARR